ncbi:sodium- and chloride-dependent taurine transporter-like [Saccoglossus kowalevskii]|uniref:Transporter n=1 Tax=Saccoglossus kowalevskii TaxID=10224 RepID=A0ABM0MMP2_SACKO|nr:PREDICTED: sodium- and chloride-dependent taurine transporter-like [Saccoglossus kowalevskii]
MEMKPNVEDKVDVQYSDVETGKEDEKEDEIEREQWIGKADFVLALIGFSVGLGNIWRFPYLCYKNGGGAFLIPYFIMLLGAGAPLLILEVGLGQFMSQGGITAWLICPLFQGIGYANTVIVQWLNIYYIVILAWAFFYMFHSFTAKLPWETCGNWWNTPACVDDYISSSNSSGLNSTLDVNATRVASVVEFWERKALKLSDGIEDMGSMNWPMAGCLLVAWITVYLCVFKGVKSTGRVVYFTATFPYVLITILCIRAVTLPNAIEGIIFYLKPDVERLKDSQVWIDAGTQIFFSYSIGLGTLVALGSYNKFKNNFVRDCIIFACFNSGTSIYGGFVIFSTLGFMAGKYNVPVGEVAKSGPGLAFIAYPAAVAEMPIAPLWSILFFFMVILLGLDSEFVGVEGFVTAICDLFPKQLRTGKYRKPLFIAGCCFIWFLVGLILIMEGGMYVFQIFDYYCASGIALLWVSFFEAAAIGWVYGSKRMYQHFEHMLGWRPDPWNRICWIVFTPLFCASIFIFSCVSYSPLTYERSWGEYVYPDWAIGLGWVMALSSIICIPIAATARMIMVPGSFNEVGLLERFRYCITPQLKPYQLRREEAKPTIIMTTGVFNIDTTEPLNGNPPPYNGYSKDKEAELQYMK